MLLVVDVRLAVRVAPMVYPACRVAPDIGIDDMTIVNVEEKSMVEVVGIMRVTPLGLLPCHHLALVLDDCCALLDLATSVDARPCTLERRTSIRRLSLVFSPVFAVALVARRASSKRDGLRSRRRRCVWVLFMVTSALARDQLS